MDTLTTSQAAVAGGFLGTIFTMSIILAVLMIIANWKIFTKAGEKGWKSLIPIYNAYIMFKIVGMNFWGWLIATVLPYVVVMLNSKYEIAADGTYNIASINAIGIIAFVVLIGISLALDIIYSIRLAHAFKKGAGFIVGLILLPNIFWLILAFGSAKYDKKAALKK